MLLLFKKKDLCKILGTNHALLSLTLSESIKNAVLWEKGSQYFQDSEVLRILRYFYNTKSDIDLQKMIDDYRVSTVYSITPVRSKQQA